ncbi:MAG: biotin transporter BioY [Oscillospiraceae bacterium]|nr:biotin transporter BioY [Oscillospiraceae bacterium]
MSVRDLCYAALGVALLTVCSWLSLPALLPSGVPFTLQTFAVCLLAALYGWRLGSWTVAVYLLLGAAGVPVFSGFRGGLGALLGVTGGYLAGFLLTALTVGLAADRLSRRLPVLLGAMALGLALCYAFGTAWSVLLYARDTGPISVGAALSWCVLPYLLPDAVKIVLAALLCGRLHPLLWKGRTS